MYSGAFGDALRGWNTTHRSLLALPRAPGEAVSKIALESDSDICADDRSKLFSVSKALLGSVSWLRFCPVQLVTLRQLGWANDQPGLLW